MSNIFFTSDLHLGHNRILKFGQRNHDNIEEMHEAIIKDWNETVRKRDMVWILGDIAFSLESLSLLDRMNGAKRCILGNHDVFDYTEYQKYFEKVHWFQKKYNLVMTHIPIHPGEFEFRHWTYNIHGHVHDPKKGPIDDPRYINVNIDATGTYKPIPLDEIRKKMK
jgi:calcineurin-like phosphoesterase family protein